MKKEELREFIEKLNEFNQVIDFSNDKEYKQFLDKYPKILNITNLDYYEESERIGNFIEWIEDNIDMLEEDIYDIRHIIEYYLEQVDAWTNDDWMFPNGRDNE